MRRGPVAEFCDRCGREIAPGSAFCRVCGPIVKEQPSDGTVVYRRTYYGPVGQPPPPRPPLPPPANNVAGPQGQLTGQQQPWRQSPGAPPWYPPPRTRVRRGQDYSREFIIVAAILIGLFLFAMGAMGNSWFIYDPDVDNSEFDSYWVSTRFRFGLTEADGYFNVYDDHGSMDYDLSFDLDEDYSTLDEKDAYPPIAKNTNTVVLVAMIPLVLFPVVYLIWIRARPKWPRSPLRYVPPVLALLTAFLMIAALSYFAARFPAALEGVMEEMEDYAVIDTHLGGSFYVMAVVAMMQVGMAFYCVFDERRWGRANLPAPGEGPGPPMSGGQARL